MGRSAAWIFPSGALLALFWFFVYPHGAFHLVAFDKLGSAETTGVWIAASVALGLFLNAVSTPMYRLLEGYSWPRFLRQWGVARQRAVLAEIRSMPDGLGWERGLKDEKLARFPMLVDEIAPTRLGNAMPLLRHTVRLVLDSTVRSCGRS